MTSLPDSDHLVESVKAREVLDSRGNPTVQVDVRTGTGFGRFTLPSGASKGRFEAVELRDGNRRRFHGLGVLRAVRNVEKTLGPAVIGMDSRDQEKLDSKLVRMDGTMNKGRLGANAILGVSMGVARARADTARVPLYGMVYGKRRALLPVPLMNILNGGKHADNDLSFQEFVILPCGFDSFRDALRSGSEIYHTLRKSLTRKYGKGAVNVGDEGGFAPPVSRVREALELVGDAVEEAGYSTSREVVLGLDAAADSFYDSRSRTYRVDGEVFEPGELLDFYVDLCKTFPVKSLEDPFYDEDFLGFARLTRQIGSRVQVVADDLFVTNSARVEKGVRLRAGNALLAKLNQAGTLSETVAALDTARRAGFELILSHRSGETEDTSIADLAVGLATGQIKAGAPARGERTAKYNRLLEIEEELGSQARYYGPRFLRGSHEGSGSN
jgi:enolase